MALKRRKLAVRSGMHRNSLKWREDSRGQFDGLAIFQRDNGDRSRHVPTRDDKKYGDQLT